jgi:hypothetical protein
MERRYLSFFILGFDIGDDGLQIFIGLHIDSAVPLLVFVFVGDFVVDIRSHIRK